LKKTRVQQVAEILKNNPDITIKALAKKLNTTITYAYVLRSQARSLGRPKKASPNSVPSDERQIITGFTGKQYELMDFTPMPFSVEEVLQETEENTVNHPAHYKIGGIEVIDFIEAKELNYRLGNVVKYISRADHKGDKLENLKKAQWYLNREIEKLVG